MYAIFEAKGKQWRAEEGETIRLPSLDAEPGDRVVFDRVLLAERGEDILVGRPVLRDASVAVEVTRHGRGEKIIVFKRKKRKGYRRKYGHRQDFTEVQVVEVDLEDATVVLPSEEAGAAPGAAPAEPEPEAEAEEEAPEAAAEEEAPEAGAEAPEAEEEIDVTDAAAALAQEHGLDLATVEGTGKDGRILKSDVQEAVEAAAEEEEEPEPAEKEEPGAAEEVDITGAARELAEEHGLDYTKLEGTGKDGRILKSDVQGAIEEREEE